MIERMVVFGLLCSVYRDYIQSARWATLNCMFFHTNCMFFHTLGTYGRI